MRHWLALVMLALLQGCRCGATDVDTRRFACTDDEACAEGFVCREGECQRAREPEDAGMPTDAGPPDPDVPDAGAPDAGAPDAGSVGPPSRLGFLSTPQTLAAGGCSAPVILETRDSAGNASAGASARRVNLGGTGLTLFSDAACGVALSDPQFAAGTSRLTFFFKGRTGGTVNLSAASTGLTSASQSEVILPVVRAGTCLMPANSTSVTCPVSPAQLDLTKTMLFIHASPTGSNPDSSFVRCALTARDALTCGRNSTRDDIYIVWQTVELASGLKVQSVPVSCTSSNTLQVNLGSVSTANSFLLMTHETSGRLLGDDDLATLRLTGTNKAEFQFSSTCASGWKSTLQVVEAPALQVTRGTTGKMSGTSLTLTDLPAVNPATSALLFTYRVSNTGNSVLCDRVLRGELTSATSLLFTRGAGNSSCTTAVIEDIAWERIDFGKLAQVQKLPVSVESGTTETQVSLGSVDVTRTILFATGQGMNGQAGGESSVSGGSVLGASQAAFELLDATTFSVIRDSGWGTARWSVNAVQFDP